ncbi:excisionase family DNA binding domain-containing protein [Lachnospiraceae bacterium A2]|nr:excisionase family DNA binding domain-containing protein [Lachnospiraceae bacterium A2]
MGQEVKMVTLKEASSRTGVSYDWLRKMCINGKIAHIRAGNKYLLNWDRLVDYLNTGEPEGN